MMAKEVISRATYKKVKGYNRIWMDVWLSKFALEVYNDACLDAAVAEITALRDEFGFGTHRIAKFMKKRDAVIQAINRKEFTVETALEVLNKEDGLSIRTDFNPEVPEIKEVDKSDVK